MSALCEVRVFSRQYRFAGSLDVLGLWRGAGALVDYKTGAPNDVAADLQTAAYLGALLEMQANGDTPEMLTFEPEAHRYTLHRGATARREEEAEAILLPSVTGVLQASGLIDFSRIPPTILRDARDRGGAVHQAVHYFNEGDLDVESFRADFPAYAPYLDAWLRFRQDSGFELATSWEALGDLSHLKRYAIRLKKDGTYAVEAYTKSRDYREFLTLLCALQIRSARKGTWIEMAEDL